MCSGWKAANDDASCHKLNWRHLGHCGHYGRKSLDLQLDYWIPSVNITVAVPCLVCLHSLCCLINSPSSQPTVFVIDWLLCRVFGHFETPLFVELCKHMETRTIPAGAAILPAGQVQPSVTVFQYPWASVAISDWWEHLCGTEWKT